MYPLILLARAKKVAALGKVAATSQFDAQCRRSTTFKAAHTGKNPRNLVIQACPSGDPGLYHEMSVSILMPGGRCLADVLIGIDEQGKARVLVSSGGEGDDDKNIVIHPELPSDEAVSIEGA